MSDPNTQKSQEEPKAKPAEGSTRPEEQVAPPKSETSPAAEPEKRSRPCLRLTCELVATYKVINEKYFRQQRMKGAGPKYNEGYDDKDGHYIVFHGEEILSRYTVQEVLGKGSFGTVVKAFDEKRQETVALKVVRSGSNFRNQAKLEIDILLKVNNNKSLQDLTVRILKVFDWKSHLVLVFELLSFNLYQLIKCTKFNGVSLDLNRKFAFQLLQVLDGLSKEKPPIIHCDLKPENILLKNQNRSGIRVIDFGSSCYENKRLFKYIQSRFYRSPEVILNLEYTTAIDRWSLGCVLVELHTGLPLFDGRTEEAQLSRMEALLGPVPQWMIEASPPTKRALFFHQVEKPSGQRWELKNPPTESKTLEGILGVHSGGPGGRRAGQSGHDEETYLLFLDLIKKLLVYDPKKRGDAGELLHHAFLAPVMQAVVASQQTPSVSNSSINPAKAADSARDENRSENPPLE